MKYTLSLLIAFAMFFSSCSKAKKESSETNATVKSTPAPLIKEGEYNINTDSSIVKWTGREITTKIHYGTLNLRKGMINVNARGAFSGKVIVDMNTITVQDLSGRGKNALEGHLRSDDFFSVESHPEATISFEDIDLNNIGEFEGNLTIKDISGPVKLSGEINKKGQGFESTIKLSFDRTLYNVQFRSGKFYENLGDKLIYDDIELEAKIVI
tara:strand:+ start:2165 stop:2800 length:636 start_codon:yes stop_codon:yes gene_type:complete